MLGPTLIRCATAVRRDSRFFQIAFLTCLLLFGVAARDFGVTSADAIVVFGSAFISQSIAILTLKVPLKSLLSVAVTSISILLLCRANTPAVLALVAMLAIGSKFLFSWRGKHFFNPTNFGIVAVLLFSDLLWISPGQWGEEFLLAFWIMALGASVARRARRDDISLSFLGTYLSCLLVRVLYLGQPWAVLWHQMQNGALLVFAFFMISDPRSTPDHRRGRILLGATAAVLGYFMRFHLHSPNGVFFALFFLSPITVILDTVWNYRRFEWEDIGGAKHGYGGYGDDEHLQLVRAQGTGPLPEWKRRLSSRVGSLLHPTLAKRRPWILRLLRGEGRHEPV